MAERFIDSNHSILDQLSCSFIKGNLKRSAVSEEYLMSQYSIDKESATAILEEFQSTCIDCKESTSPIIKPKPQVLPIIEAPKPPRNYEEEM